MELQKLLYTTADKATKKAANDVRIARHEIHDHLFISGAPLNNSECTTVPQKCFTVFPQSIAFSDTPVDTGNTVLDAVLNWAAFACNCHNIPLSVQVEIPHPELEIDALTLFSILSNLLANAIEFSEGFRDPMISVQIKTIQERLSIRVHNRVSAQMFVEEICAQAPKPKPGHLERGLGAGAVRWYVRQNGGTVRFILSNGMFCADVLLRLKVSLPLQDKGAAPSNDAEGRSGIEETTTEMTKDMPGIYIKRYDSDGETQEKRFFSVAVCEDNPQSRNILSSDIRKSFTQCRCSADVQSFSRLGELRRALSSAAFDVIFMDIVLPDGNGIDFVRGLRRKLPELPKVVFVSNRTDLVFEAFTAHPFSFIRKPNFRQELGGVIGDLSVLSCGHSKDILCVESDRELYSLHIPEIRYIECINKVQIIHLATRTCSVRKTLAEFEELLTPYGFIRSHKSYLVNYRYIFSVGNFDIELDDETSIPISKHRLHDVKVSFRRLLRP